LPACGADLGPRVSAKSVTWTILDRQLRKSGYGSVKSILDNKLDRPAMDQPAAEHAPIRHRNIRGGGYFH
jgi:transposase